VYFQLTSALNRRFIQELRNYWKFHPKYRDIVNNIQGKFSFDERPAHGIVIKVSGGNRVDLSADNYVGTVNSYVNLSGVGNYPGTAIEWVREDAVAIGQNGGVFPSPPGTYYIELTGDEEFYIDQLLDVYREPLTMSDTLDGQLQSPPLAGSLRLYELPAGTLLSPGNHYTVETDDEGTPTGGITLANPLLGGRTLSADYRTAGATTGPHVLFPNRGNNTAIPGCVLAFGNRNGRGDRLAVVVTPIRTPTALEYGGKWSLNFDFDVMSRDIDHQREIADLTIMYIWGLLRSRLSTEGIEITDVSMGGEAEEPYDETGDDYLYTSSFSLTAETEWSIHEPLNVYLRQAIPLTVEAAEAIASLPDDELTSDHAATNIQPTDDMTLLSIRDPYFSGRNRSFEVIK
jgi:hypothetical protein